MDSDAVMIEGQPASYNEENDMESPLMPKRTHLALTGALLLALLFQYGCAQQCAQVKSDYGSAISAEATLLKDLKLQQGLPTHIGVGLRYQVLSQVAARFLGTALDKNLDLTTAIPLGGGKNINVQLAGDALNLKFEPDKSCATCFRVVGDLGGDASVTIPLLGTRKIPLNGSLNLIAPLIMEALDDGSVKVKLDLTKLADYADSFLQMDLDGLPEATARLIKQPLTREVLARLSANLKPIDLFSFKAPDLGIASLRIFPSEFKLVPESKALFVGFTTNLPGVAPGQGVSSAQAVQFADNENMAVSLQPAILLPAVSALIQQGTIPRRYTLQGQADPNGNTHLTMKNVSVGESSTKQGAEPLSLGFRAWNMAGGPCFWFDALLTGLIDLQDGKLRVDIQDIQLTDASAAPELVRALASWKKAEFVDRTRTLIERALTAPRIEIPGGALVLAPNSLAKDARTLTLRSLVKVELGK